MANTPPLGAPPRRAGARGVHALPQGVRRGLVGPAQRDDDGLPDRPVRQPEHQRHRRLGPAQGPADRGPRGARATPSTTPPATGCPTTRPASFVEQVDMVSGVGLRPGRGGRAGGHPVPRDPRVVVSNLGVFDFETPDHAMRLRSVHPGVTVEEIVEATGFELGGPRRRAQTPAAHRRGARADPRGARPEGAAGPRGPLVTRTGGPPAAHPALCGPRFCELVGVRVPHRPDRHGLGGRPPAGGGHGRGRRPGDPGLGHHDLRPAGRGHRRGPVADRPALRGQPPHRRRRRRRPGGPDDRQRGQGGQLRPGPPARAGDPVPARPAWW